MLLKCYLYGPCLVLYSFPHRNLCPEHGPGEKTLDEYRNQRERVRYMEKQVSDSDRGFSSVGKITLEI